MVCLRTSGKVILSKTINMKTEDEIHAENAMMRLQMEMLYNGNTYMPRERKVSPRLENLFLKHVINFEQQYQNNGKVTVYERIGEPAFNDYRSLTLEEASRSLENLLYQMEENGVVLLYDDSHDELEVYRYLTEELFETEIDNIRIKGTMIVFFYENEDRLSDDWEMD